MTVEELAGRVGAVRLWRIRNDPPPGSATEADVQRLRREESVLCELIDGVLVEKAVSDVAAFLAMELGRLLGNFVAPRRLGWVPGPDGFVWLFGTRLRAPDVSFVRRDQRPAGPAARQRLCQCRPGPGRRSLQPGKHCPRDGAETQ